MTHITDKNKTWVEYLIFDQVYGVTEVEYVSTSPTGVTAVCLVSDIWHIVLMDDTNKVFHMEVL